MEFFQKFGFTDNFRLPVLILLAHEVREHAQEKIFAEAGNFK